MRLTYLTINLRNTHKILNRFAKMWKGFLHYNRSQKIGILIVLILIVLAMLASRLIPSLFKPKDEIEDTAFLEEAARFRENLVEIERSKRGNYEEFDNYYKSYPKKTLEDSHSELFAFDPNKADSSTFVHLGLKPYIAKNILKYRSKGGKFRKPEDFAKVYGVTPEKFEELRPYIAIDGNKPDEQTISSISDTKPTEIQADKPEPKANLILELNSADTTALMQISGIGRATAKGIANYRRILGGYYSVEQLKEVYGMRPENFDKIKSHFTIDASLINKINVNTASVDRLKSHPYIKTFQRAKAIYELRRKKVKLNNISDLRILEELTDEDLSRLEPYLEFR